jgi:peptidoglycan/LPS O-acetylase OafA/YrhL
MQGTKLPGLDVLRGIAILLVIFAHFLAPTLNSSIVAGNAGVILFFLLSGYLMDKNLAIDPAIGPYAIRRAFRILPPYWLSIALIALTTSNWSAPQIAANAAFTAPLFGFERMSGVYWTLYVEVTFYVLAPILFVLSNIAIRFAPIAFAGLIVAFWAVRGVSIIAPMYVLFCLIGMMVGSLHREGLTSWFTPITQIKFRPLEVCGHVSYSWYLTHFIIGVPILHLGAQYGMGRWLPCIVAAVVSFFVSVMIFRCFEKPMIEVGRKVVKRLTFPRLVSEQRS